MHSDVCVSKEPLAILECTAFLCGHFPGERARSPEEPVTLEHLSQALSYPETQLTSGGATLVIGNIKTECLFIPLEY